MKSVDVMLWVAFSAFVIACAGAVWSASFAGLTGATATPAAVVWQGQCGQLTVMSDGKTICVNVAPGLAATVAVEVPK